VADDLSGSGNDDEWVRAAYRESARARYGIPRDVPDELLFDAVINAMGGPSSESLEKLHRQREAQQTAEKARRQRTTTRQVIGIVAGMALTGVGALIARASHNDAAGVIVLGGAIVGAIMIFTKSEKD
jgi:hypothetical protein